MNIFDFDEERPDEATLESSAGLDSSDLSDLASNEPVLVNGGDVYSPGELYHDQLGNIFFENAEYVEGINPWLPDPSELQSGGALVSIYPAEDWGFFNPLQLETGSVEPVDSQVAWPSEFAAEPSPESDSLSGFDVGEAYTDGAIEQSNDSSVFESSSWDSSVSINDGYDSGGSSYESDWGSSDSSGWDSSDSSSDW